MKNAVLTVSVLLAFLICGCQKKEETPAASAETVTKETDLKKTGTPAAKASYEKTNYYFRLPNAKGGEIDLKDYAGKPALVMFFTDNCPYCRKAAPFIRSLHEKYASKGLSVIGVSVKSDPSSASAFGKDFALKFDLAYNGGAVSRTYGIQGVPFIYLLDKDHERVKTWPGYDESYDEDMDKTVGDSL